MKKKMYDYRYIVFDFNRNDEFAKHVGHKHFCFQTDKEAIDFIPKYESRNEWTVLEVERSQNDDGMVECEFYKSIWSKEK